MDQSGAGKKRIGELLSKEGHITANQLQDALKYQEQHSGRLGSILIRLGYIDEDTIVNVLNRIYNFPISLLSKVTPEPEALKTLPYEIAKNYMVFPLKLTEDTSENDVERPRQGYVTLTPIKYDLTDHDALGTIRDWAKEL